MDTRRAMAIGGGATAVATIAVATAIAWTNQAALSDSPGTPVAAAGVVVPAPSATPTATPEPSASVPAPAATPVTVPAPEPGIVDSHSSASGTSSTAPSTPSRSTPSQTSDANHPQSKWRAWESGRALIAEAAKTGDWDPVRAWARSLGWSEKQIDAWIAVWQERYGDGRSWHHRSDDSADEAGTSSGSTSPNLDSGSKREQPPYTPK